MQNNIKSSEKINTETNSIQNEVSTKIKYTELPKKTNNQNNELINKLTKGFELNDSEKFHLLDLATSFEEKIKIYQRNALYIFYSNLCSFDISANDLEQIIKEVESKKDTYLKELFRFSILKYRFCSNLNFTDLLIDGFFDYGFTSSLTNNSNYSTNNFLNKKFLINTEHNRYQIRENIIFNSKNDSLLKNILDECKLLVKNESAYQKIINIILRIHGTECDNYKFNKFMSSNFAKYNNINVKIGDIRYGLDRHKSLLFKYLCDNIGLICSIFRKNNINEDSLITESHTWNLIKIKNNLAIVDFRYFPGRILAPNNQFTIDYYKINSI